MRIIILMLINLGVYSISFSQGLVLTNSFENKRNIYDETVKLFNSLPVDYSVHAILKDSSLNFNHKKEFNGVSLDTWTARLDTLTYLDSSVDDIYVKLTKDSDDTGLKGYHVSLRFSIKEKNKAINVFNKAKNAFEVLGAKVDNETIVDENRNVISINSEIRYTKGKNTDIYGPDRLLFELKEKEGSYHIFIDYYNLEIFPSKRTKIKKGKK